MLNSHAPSFVDTSYFDVAEIKSGLRHPCEDSFPLGFTRPAPLNSTTSDSSGFFAVIGHFVSPCPEALSPPDRIVVPTQNNHGNNYFVPTENKASIPLAYVNQALAICKKGAHNRGSASKTVLIGAMQRGGEAGTGSTCVAWVAVTSVG
jgi:hypothetical protein